MIYEILRCKDSHAHRGIVVTILAHRTRQAQDDTSAQDDAGIIVFLPEKKDRMEEYCNVNQNGSLGKEPRRERRS